MWTFCGMGATRLSQASSRSSQPSFNAGKDLFHFSSRSLCRFCSFQFCLVARLPQFCPRTTKPKSLPSSLSIFAPSVPNAVAGCYLRPRRRQLTGPTQSGPGRAATLPNMHEGLFASSFQILITGGIRFSSSALRGLIRRRRRSPRGQPCPVAAS